MCDSASTQDHKSSAVKTGHCSSLSQPEGFPLGRAPESALVLSLAWSADWVLIGQDHSYLFRSINQSWQQFLWNWPQCCRNQMGGKKSHMSFISDLDIVSYMSLNCQIHIKGKTLLWLTYSYLQLLSPFWECQRLLTGVRNGAFLLSVRLPSCC